MTDTSMTALTKSINTIGTAFEEFKSTNDQIVSALKKGNETLAAELTQKLTKIESDLSVATKAKKDIETEMQLQRERIEELESKRSSPGKTETERRSSEYKDAFTGWIRNRGTSPTDEQKLADLARKMYEAKDVTIGSPAGGGYALPEEISRSIEEKALKFSPVRRLVKVVTTGSSDYKELVNIRGTSSGWVGESGTRSATNTPQLREVAPTFGELYAYPQASEWSLDDLFFNVDQWLSDNVAQEFAFQEGLAVISGDGSSKPTGMLHSAPTSVADNGSPLRAAAVFQFVASAASPDAILPDSIIDLTYTLNAAYRANATFVMNSVTTGAVRKLKDTTGQYLWQPSLQAGQPDRLLGFNFETWEQMDDVGANKFPIAFGDFSRGYVLADRVGTRITRDNVTNVGFIRFYVRKRVGGIVLNNDAIKFLKTT